ncbi:MAG: phosphohistidine phosphatase SixA [Oceanospirillaceae bacterium]|nr:phosphohistidine phosphatase SixA [Oceanospirillaceae bacterium]
MKLYLMRHGEAGFDAPSDFDRSLTERGIMALDRMLSRERAVLDDVSAVLPSPYLRARQTADRVVSHLGVPLLEPNTAFIPDIDTRLALAALESSMLDGLLLVSHQPLIGKLVATLIEGDARRPEPMLPGAVAILELDWPAAGLATLLKKLHV